MRVGNNRPDLGQNPICNRFTGSLEEGRPLFLPCNPPMPGAFVSVHFEGITRKYYYACLFFKVHHDGYRLEIMRAKMLFWLYFPSSWPKVLESNFSTSSNFFFTIAGPPGVSLSICEAFVYTDQALPIERCPTFRDQPPGGVASYNGKCYIFYNQQPKSFQVFRR